MGSRFFLALSRWVLIVALLVVGLSGETCNAKDDGTKCTSSCGNIHNISYPFRLQHDPKHCGNVMYTLTCENNITLVVDIPPSGKYYVQAINYHNQTIRLVDPGLQNNNCSSISQNFPLFLRDPYSAYNKSGYLLSTPVFYIKCSNPVNSSLYVDTAPCLNTNAPSLVQQKTYSYVKVGVMEVGDLNEGCSAEWLALALLSYSNGHNTSYEFVHSALMYGFELGVYWPDETAPICQGQWSCNYKCFPHSIPGFFRLIWEAIYGFFSRGRVYIDNPLWFRAINFRRGWVPLICFGLFFPARLSFGVPCLIALVIYKW